MNPSVVLFLCAVLWSSGGILIKLTDWNPLAIAGTRSLIGAITMMIVLQRIPKLPVKKDDGSVDIKQTADKIIATVAYSATMILFVQATKLTTAANAILLQYTNVLYVIIFGPILLGEKNTWVDYLSAGGIFTGMILLVSGGFDNVGLTAENITGIVYALLSGFAFGCTTIFMRRQKDGHPEDSFILSHVLTFIIAIPVITASGVPGVQSMGALLLLGIFQIGLSSVLYAWGIRRVHALTAVLITMSEPVMNPVWVLIFYKEIPTAYSVAGGIIILAFLFFRVYGKQKRIA